jgi:hypothetical protein
MELMFHSPMGHLLSYNSSGLCSKLTEPLSTFLDDTLEQVASMFSSYQTFNLLINRQLSNKQTLNLVHNVDSFPVTFFNCRAYLLELTRRYYEIYSVLLPV